MDFLKALKLLTILPVPVDDEVLEIDRLSPWFPLAGAVTGGLLLLVYDILGLMFPEAVTGVFVVLFWVFIGGGRTIKGLCNWVRRSGSAKNETLVESILYASLVIVAIVLLKSVIIADLKWQFLSKALILAPIAGSWGIVIALAPGFSLQPEEEGTAAFIKRVMIQKEVIYASVAALGLSLILSGFTGLLLFIFCGCVMFLVSAVSFRLSGAISLESAYSVGEVGEMFILMMVMILMKLFIMGY